jgi:hypothetical protein
MSDYAFHHEEEAERLRQQHRQSQALPRPGNGHDKGEAGSPGQGIPGPDPTAAPGEEDWPEIEAEAFHGLAGKIVSAIEPISEADPVALLVQFLAMVGNALGRHASYLVGKDTHYTNLYTVLCGISAKGRKGTAYGLIESLLGEAQPQWLDHCIMSGLSSGEGVIHRVHDDIWVPEKVSHGKDNPPTYERVLKEESVADKRLMIVEAEFGSALTIMHRPGNTLSSTLRLGWDGKRLQTSPKHNAETATGAHVSMIGHITIAELRATLDRVSMANGFGNRILFVLAKRSKEVPFPSWLPDGAAAAFTTRLREILDNTIIRRPMTFRPEAADLWRAEYHELSAEKRGLCGHLTNRAEAQVLRLSMIYALLDEANYMWPAHLRAGLAFWRYCEASARYIFGDAIGERTADEILLALRAAGPDGMTRRDIHDLFSHNKSSETIGNALNLLSRYSKVTRRMKPAPGRGRPTEIWIAV